MANERDASIPHQFSNRTDSSPDENVTLVHNTYFNKKGRPALRLQSVRVTVAGQPTEYRNWDSSQPYTPKGVYRLNNIVVNRLRKTATIAFECIDGSTSYATFEIDKTPITPIFETITSPK